MGEIKFNGISTADLGVIIQTPPAYEFPEKDYNVVHIPGRNGDIVIDQGSFKNTKRTYYLAVVYRPGTNFIYNATAITTWLESAKGYAKLEDSYDPEVFRYAMFRDSGELHNAEDAVLSIEVTFECKPQRYLKSGDKEMELIDNGEGFVADNPTKFISLPIIQFCGSSAIITFENGDYKETLNVKTNSSIFIDSELQEVYSRQDDGTIINENKNVEMNDFPKFYPGKTKITIDGTYSLFVFKPRWWKL